GAELLYPRSTLSSSVAAGAFGPGTPPAPLAGSSSSDSGVFPLPSFGLVYRPEDSPWTFGAGLFAVGGFGVNFAADRFNPVLTPQPPRGLGLGNLYTLYQVIQMTPAVAYRLTESLSAGVALTGDLAGLSVDPFVLAPPDDA